MAMTIRSASTSPTSAKKISEVTDEEYIKTIWGVGFMLV